MNKIMLRGVAMLAVLAVVVPAQAQTTGANTSMGADNPPPMMPMGTGTMNPGMGQHHAPPPEAFAACAGKTAGAACAVPARQGNGTLEGTCRTPPPGANDTRLACAPKFGPGGPGQGGLGGQGQQGGPQGGPPPSTGPQGQ